LNISKDMNHLNSYFHRLIKNNFVLRDNFDLQKGFIVRHGLYNQADHISYDFTIKKGIKFVKNNAL
jgi:hypothetical protein